MINKRRSGKRPYKRLVIIATEGHVTEPEYFNLFPVDKNIIQIKLIRKKHRTSPKQVLRFISNELKNQNFRKSDLAWMVIDVDNWQDADLNLCAQWAATDHRRGFAVSNPSFEYWLLLHFEDCAIQSAAKCGDKLLRYLPQYDKHIKRGQISLEQIKDAVARAKARDVNRQEPWPASCGTTVYQLVEQLLA